jgi:hypothetical protein
MKFISKQYAVEPSRKKKPLNDAELALRREETARKRKNMSEKKLEDEKASPCHRSFRPFSLNPIPYPT